MSDPILYRATLDIVAEGRTLEGLAVPWNKPATVSDGGPAYKEEFHPNAFNRTLSRRKEPFPLFSNHGWRKGEDPVGAVTFTRSHEGLMFEARMSETRDGDDQLTLVRDGVKNAVSIGFKPIHSVKRGDVTVRTEVALRELSLAATGFGQHPDAKVLALRDLEEEQQPDWRQRVHDFVIAAPAQAAHLDAVVAEIHRRGKS